MQLPVSRTDAGEPQQSQQGDGHTEMGRGNSWGQAEGERAFFVTRSIIREDSHTFVPQIIPNICKVRLHLPLLVAPEQLSHPNESEGGGSETWGWKRNAKMLRFAFSF